MCLLFKMSFDIFYIHFSHLGLITRKVLAKYYKLYVSLLYRGARGGAVC
jgi:hypothetical protein